jgi:N-sulfoglucosamine sulfohydrolase
MKAKPLILTISLIVLSGKIGIPVLAAEKMKPNILFILSDDHSVPHVGCYGDENCLKFDITPNLDAFAKESMAFTRAYTTAPQCAPSRVSIFTGRSPISTRTSRFGQPAQKETVLFTDILKQNGYWVGVDGRGHHLDGRNVSRRHVKEQFEASEMFVHDRFDHVEIGRTSNQWLSKVPDSFSALIDETPRDQPFFLYYIFNQPHRPWTKDISGINPDELKLPPDWPDIPEVREDYARYLSDLRNMDWGFGQIDSILEARGLKDNTIVVFMGDNGEALLRGKGTLYSRGINVPLIIRWPEKIKPHTMSDIMISGEDIAPTLLQIAGLEPIDEMTGVSFLPELLGERLEEREYVFAERSWQGGYLTRADGFDLIRTVISENYQFIYNVLPDRPYAPCDMGDKDVWKKMQQDVDMLSEQHRKLYFQNPRPIVEFYDLRNDPFQLENLWGNSEIKEIEKKLRIELDKWIIREGDFVPIMDELSGLGGGKRGIQE